MKKMLIFLLVPLLFGCGQSEPSHEVTEPIEAEEDVIEVEQEKTVKEAAKEIVSVLHNKDIDRLQTMIHPEKGVYFSPYAYVDHETDVHAMPTDLVEWWEGDQTFVWGAYDGKGNPIELTFNEYYDEFIYSEEFINAEKMSVNERLGQGNTLDNSQEVYRGATIVEFHFSGFEEEFEGMDWRSLRLALEQLDGEWYIVGMINDQWTI